MVFHLRSPQSANDAAAIERAMFEAKEKSMQAQLDALMRDNARLLAQTKEDAVRAPRTHLTLSR